MSKVMKPIKPRKMWAVADADGDIYAWTIGGFRKDSIQKMEEGYSDEWKNLRKKFRCIKVNVSEADHE